ncbi:hypothetical protein HanOQP8_Chr05g0180181 [Helianthus annuus]|nr:hypothetical protein HanIR_Chr05g0222881 [Helianthus annuus]KAJ0746633.1 hypothetical protein HanOQP8_Chr05g0180181 [Helianthus annuus]
MSFLFRHWFTQKQRSSSEAITARFFRSMEHVVQHTRAVTAVDPVSNVKTVKHEKVWNFTVAVSLLAFGPSFPQISLATVWSLNVITFWEALFTVLQYMLVLLHVYAQDKRWPYISIPLERSERPEEWVPVEASTQRNNNLSFQYEKDGDKEIVDIFSIHEEHDGLWVGRVLWHMLVAPWRLLFAFVLPCEIAHGCIAFICSLMFISGIAYIV